MGVESIPKYVNSPFLQEDGKEKAGSYEYDYQEPYFEPAMVEEDLLVQLTSKLSVQEIVREELK